MTADLKCIILGTANGSGHVYRGTCSTSFLLLKDGSPFILVDLGLGVMGALATLGFDLPDHILVTHNHSDHAGELPVVLRVEENRGKKRHVIAHSDIAEALKVHRMAEHAALLTPEDLAYWHTSEGIDTVTIDAWTIGFLACQHSTPCYGFWLEDPNGDRRLAYSADSVATTDLYGEITKARTTIFNARLDRNPYHATFDDLAPWLSPDDRIIGHNFMHADELPDEGIAADARAQMMFPGDVLAIP